MPPRAPAIRPATASDGPAVRALLERHGLPLDGVPDDLAGFVVADGEAGVLAGVAGLERYGDAALLRSVAVDAAGQGTGAALLARVLADAEAAGVRTVILLTTTAEAYFPRFGFARVDRAAVPDAVRASAEFRGACPASAAVMMRTFEAEAHALP